MIFKSPKVENHLARPSRIENHFSRDGNEPNSLFFFFLHGSYREKETGLSK